MTDEKHPVALVGTTALLDFDRLFAQAPIFVAVLEGPDHLITYINPRYQTLVGDRAVLGKTVADALPDAVEQGYLTLLDRVFRDGKPVAIDGSPYAVQATAGGPVIERYVDFVYQPIRDDAQNVRGILLVGVDVTDRTTIDRDAKRSIERVMMALYAGDGIATWEYAIDTDLVHGDPRFFELFGFDNTGAALHLADLLSRVHPDDRALCASVFTSHDRTMPQRQWECRLGTNSTSRWIEGRGHVQYNVAGAPDRIAGVFIDVTERKATEQRLAAIAELTDAFRNLTNPDDIAYAGAEVLARTLNISRAGYGTIDLANETIEIGRDWNGPGVQSIAGTLHFRDYGSYIEDLKRGDTVVVSNAEADPRTLETADNLKSISAHSFINMPLTENGGFVALFFANHAEPRDWRPAELTFMREIAERTRVAVERRRMEADLIEREAELRRANETLEARIAERTAELMAVEETLRQAQKMEAVGQLTGGLAHDFNNILAGIGGSVEMMSTRLAQGRIGDLDRYITGAMGAVRRATALTQRLLAFSRRQTLDPKPTDINALINGMLDLINRSVGPNIAVETAGAAGLWTTFIDAGQLENALLNLCINARDAMPDGGRLTIETSNRWMDERAARERDLVPGQYLSLCVSDTGTGMPPDVVARAFDPFFTTKPTGQGTGLGLSMVYGFTGQSGGSTSIYSEVGKGTMICLYLPRHLGEAVEQSELEPANALVPRADHSETILVVDDEPLVRMVAVEQLEELGYTVIEAGDGPSALKILNSNQVVDLLITDVGMPGGMNGRQLADAARTTRPELEVLFITGYAENAVLNHGHLDHGMHVMTKPFQMDVFARRVKGLIAKTD